MEIKISSTELCVPSLATAPHASLSTLFFFFFQHKYGVCWYLCIYDVYPSFNTWAVEYENDLSFTNTKGTCHIITPSHFVLYMYMMDELNSSDMIWIATITIGEAEAILENTR